MIRSLIAIVNLLVSVGVPLWTEAAAPNVFSKSEQVILGVTLFIALTVIEIFVMAEKAFAKELRVAKIWDARDELDARLQEVRRLFHEVEEHRVGETDLFVSFFNKKLVDLETSLRDACSKNEVRIDETMLEVTTWLLQASFRGREADLFRAVLFSADVPFFVDMHSKRYFSQVYGMVSSGKARGVRRLIVYAADTELKDPVTEKILAFHHHMEHYDARVLSQRVFQQIVRDYALHYLVKDFGIYGRSYLYKGIINKSEEIVGSYSRDRVEIDRFIDCFEICWQAGVSPAPAHEKAEISVDWLFTN